MKYKILKGMKNDYNIKLFKINYEKYNKNTLL